MKFKLDENLPLEIADTFRDAGHEIDSVQSEGLTGASDLKILEQVRLENQILLTMDKGIADVRLFPPSQYPGSSYSAQPHQVAERCCDSFNRP
ncbi:MAG: DUF5615 family PIN-like protein [Bryobacteraceae bacterium]